MATLHTPWRWVRISLFLFALLVIGLGAWVTWSLTDQRYQRFLTQYLSGRLEAEVQIGTSHITVRRGLGITLAQVTIRERRTSAPFFTAEAIDVLLDVSALLDGHFDFRQITLVKPVLHVIQGGTQETILRLLRRKPPAPETHEAKRWFTPRITLQKLTAEKGTVTYSRATSTVPLLFTPLNAAVTYTTKGAITARLETAIGQRGELGALTFYAQSHEGGTRGPFMQRHWQGEITLSDTPVHQLGHLLGEQWPIAVVGFSGQYAGQWTGPAEVAGLISLRDLQIGTTRISQGRVRLEKLSWAGLNSKQSALDRASVMRALVVNTRIEEIQSTLGETHLPLVVHQGTVRFAGDKQKTEAGEITLRDVAFRLPTRDLVATELNGKVQVSSEKLTLASLIGTVGGASFTMQGQLQRYQSDQRHGDLQVTFSDLPDQTVVPLLPERLILANKGTLSGNAKVTVAPGKNMATSGVVQLRGIQSDPLRFLHPFTIATGDVRWQGKSGKFTVTQGQLEGAAFTGRGHISGGTPALLEVSLDFPALNVPKIIAIDAPRPVGAKPQKPLIVKAHLTCRACSYKTVQATDLQMSVHWHDRQAEMHVLSANVAGGTVQGEVTFWPDLGSLYFAPHMIGIDMQRLFHTIGKPSDILTGTAAGDGKIYVENWRQWANPAYWDAVLSVRIADGVAQRIPILVRLWSTVSLQGILRLQGPELPSEGLAFSTLTGDLAFGRGLAVTKNVSLNGDAVRIEAHGEINLLANAVDLMVQLVLLHGVTSALEWVPLVGNLLARGTDLLTTVPVHITGPYKDPTVIPTQVKTG